MPSSDSIFRLVLWKAEDAFKWYVRDQSVTYPGHITNNTETFVRGMELC